MHKTTQILSDITVFSKYAKYIPSLSRRETYDEILQRNCMMHMEMYPGLADEIAQVYMSFVADRKVLPSMRSMQFGGAPIFKAPSRIFNCAYAPAEMPSIFSEAMFLLLGGTGMGYSVQSRHVDQLPPLAGPDWCERRFLVGDSIEGWADAIKVLVEAYFYGKPLPRFDFSDIRPKGAELITSGGKAPGPEPLAECVKRIEDVMKKALKSRGKGTQLKTIEVHDMLCFIADAVLAGGIRRAALICLFDRNDDEMLTCKSGEWYIDNPQRGRANNSAVLPRAEVHESEFKRLWKEIENSGSGEPGVYFTNDPDWGTNPCCEIALKPYQFCNLTEINATDVVDQEDLEARSRAASFIGTLQAGYTNFHYLNPRWKATTEEDALIGVGMTGIASGAVLGLDLVAAAKAVTSENARVAKLIGINKAARTTTVKPSGTSSLVLGSSSGIHAWHSHHYIRRMRIGKNEPLYGYLIENHPELVEDENFRPDSMAVISIPQEAPEGSIIRTEDPSDLLERVSRFNTEWVRTGHIAGKNAHNVSCTISVKDDEWDAVGNWMWDHRHEYNGIAVLPYHGGSYVQAPFEDISKSDFDHLSKRLHEIDLTNVHEEHDNTDLAGEVACGSGGCEVT